ncbi:PAS domain-containing sensor histidine kinase [Hyphobacterium sp.]|uniref:PAS domain-containing sensor histidine kinase n=1 Tax=Hyphobacterium sp. TaxID=2004662 RepID=UPI003BA9B758
MRILTTDSGAGMSQSTSIAATLEQLFRRSPDAIVVVHADRTIWQVNTAFEKLSGYRAAEVLGRTTDFLYTSKVEYNRIWASREKTDSGLFSTTYRQSFVRKDGSQFTGEAVGIPIRDETGEPTGHITIVRDVTDEPKTRAPATETEKLFLDALESSRETAWRFDLASEQIDVAGPVAQTVFKAEGPVIRLTLEEWKARLTPDSRDRCDRLVREIITKGEAQADLVFEESAGESIIISDRGRVVSRNADGSPSVIAGLFTDVTEHKSLEQRFAETDIYLSTALEAADLAAWRFDLVENITRLAGPLTRYLDLESQAGEFTGAYWCSFVHRDDLGEVIRQTAAMAEGRSDTVNLLYRVRDADNSWRWIRSIGRVTEKSADGNGLVANGIIHDVTDSIELQERLESERNRFERIFRRTPAMLQQINAQGIITDVSAYWLSHLGYERNEVIGKAATLFLSKESRIYAEQHALPDFLSSGKARNVALQFRKKNGDVIDGLLNAYLETDPQSEERTGYCVITDVTQLRRAYRDLERSNRELDRFATIASHDLQEPLRKISAFSTLLRTRYGGRLDSDGDRSLEFLADAAGRMQSLIDNLLEYAQLESRPLKPRKISLKAMIGEVEERLADRVARTGTTIRLIGKDELVADPFLLMQCLQNLISNAIKYRSDAAPEIKVELAESDSGWILTVSDNGVGFDPKFADKIFEPFRRLHPRGQYDGAGIGLAIVRQSIDRQNGRISVEARPGKGSKFSMWLPNRRQERNVA